MILQTFPPHSKLLMRSAPPGSLTDALTSHPWISYPYSEASDPQGPGVPNGIYDVA
jgi:hypothetical protein